MTAFLITCCNATCAVPEAQRELFKGSEERVTSTEGWEPGALNLAQGMAMKLSTPLIHGDVTRLLIDLEEIGDKQWSSISLKIPEASRSRLGDRHNEKFHLAIESRLTEDFKRNDAIIHLDIHTSPSADGKITFEHAGDQVAKLFAENVAKIMSNPEVDISVRPLDKRSSFINWILTKNEGGKLGVVRIDVSQSFFLNSVPLRWETVKRNLIAAISTAAK